MGLAVSANPQDVQFLAGTTTGNGTTDGHSDHEEHDETSGLAIMFLSFTLLLGTSTYTIVQRFGLPIPYTVLMLILGMLVGATNIQGGSGSNWFHEAMDM